jgi:hypothetical protein
MITELGEESETSVICVAIAGVAVIICTQLNDGVTTLLKVPAESCVHRVFFSCRQTKVNQSINQKVIKSSVL